MDILFSSNLLFAKPLDFTCKRWWMMNLECKQCHKVFTVNPGCSHRNLVLTPRCIYSFAEGESLFLGTSLFCTDTHTHTHTDIEKDTHTHTFNSRCGLCVILCNLLMKCCITLNSKLIDADIMEWDINTNSFTHVKGGVCYFQVKFQVPASFLHGLAIEKGISA